MKLKFLLFFIILSGLLQAQNTTIYFTVQPTDLGLGIRCDQLIKVTHNDVVKEIFLYGSASKGNYKTDYATIDDHYKFSLGGIITSRFFYYGTFISAGLNYHLYGEKYFPTGLWNNQTVTPVSIDLGVGTQLSKRLIIAFRMDIIKWESSIDFGINF